MTNERKRRSAENRREAEINPRRFQEYETEGQKSERRVQAVITEYPRSPFRVIETTGIDDERNKIDFKVQIRNSKREQAGEPPIEHPVQMKTRDMDDQEFLNLIHRGVIPVEFNHEVLYQAVFPDDFESELTYHLNTDHEINTFAGKISYHEFYYQFKAFARVALKVRNGKNIPSDEDLLARRAQFHEWRQVQLDNYKKAKEIDDNRRLRAKFPEYFEELDKAA